MSTKGKTTLPPSLPTTLPDSILHNLLFPHRKQFSDQNLTLYVDLTDVILALKASIVLNS